MNYNQFGDSEEEHTQSASSTFTPGKMEVQMILYGDIWTYPITSPGYKCSRFPCHADTSLPNSNNRSDKVKTRLIRYIINGPVTACDGNIQRSIQI